MISIAAILPNLKSDHARLETCKSMVQIVSEISYCDASKILATMTDGYRNQIFSLLISKKTSEWNNKWAVWALSFEDDYYRSQFLKTCISNLKAIPDSDYIAVFSKFKDDSYRSKCLVFYLKSFGSEHKISELLDVGKYFFEESYCADFIVAIFENHKDSSVDILLRALSYLKQRNYMLRVFDEFMKQFPLQNISLDQKLKIVALFKDANRVRTALGLETVSETEEEEPKFSFFDTKIPINCGMSSITNGEQLKTVVVSGGKIIVNGKQQMSAAVCKWNDFIFKYNKGVWVVTDPDFNMTFLEEGKYSYDGNGTFAKL